MPPAPAHTPLARLYRRRRRQRRNAALCACGVGVLLLLVLKTASAAARTRAAMPILRYTIHIVVPGETLWSIAAGRADGNTDVRYEVYRLQCENGLRSSLISPGEALRIPRDGE